MTVIERLRHIGILVHDLDAATRFWCETYGLRKYAEYSTPVEGLRAVLLSVNGSWDEMSIELIEPLDKSDLSNPVARRLARHGEGFYHLAVQTRDVDGTAAALAARGLPVLRRDPVAGLTGPRWLVDPRASSGVMVEGL